MRVYGNGKCIEVESFAKALSVILHNDDESQANYFTTEPGTPEREKEILKTYPGLFE
jgi:hypothetical protein